MRLNKFILAAIIILSISNALFAQEEPLQVPFLGVKIDEAEGKGALITDIQKESPADKAGFIIGDIMVKWGDRKMSNTSDFMLNLYSQEPGDSVTIMVKRDGKTVQVYPLLGTSEDEYADVYNYIPTIVELFRIEMMGYAVDELGIMTGNIPRGLLEYFHVEYGVVIELVEENSQGAKKGLMPGDIIYEINGKEIKSTIDFRTELNQADKIKLKFNRRGKKMDVTLRNREAGK